MAFQEFILEFVLKEHFTSKCVSSQSFWAQYDTLFDGYHKFSQQYLSKEVLDRVFERKQELVNERIRQAIHVDLYVDGWDGSKRKKCINLVVTFIINDDREYYFYDCDPFESCC